MIRDYRNNN